MRPTKVLRIDILEIVTHLTYTPMSNLHHVFTIFTIYEKGYGDD